jgi:hypothetical protein
MAYVINKEQIAIAMECLKIALMQYPGRVDVNEKSAIKASVK